MESDLARNRPRRYIVRATKGGEEVVEHVIIGKVDHGNARAPLVFLAVEDVVIAAETSNK
jgi:hypothetical protein